MSSEKVRVRFAPSPTGDLHIGNVRAALFNWLYARKHNGTFVLRIEDTDTSRSTEESMQRIMEDLKWLGLNYDEGPDIGGPYGPYRQSQRLHIYQEYANKLLNEGKAYRCFCKALGREESECKCHLFSKEKVEELLSKNTPYAIRIYVPPEKKRVKFKDIVFGEVEKEVENFVLIKSDGYPTYHMAVVVDDYLMKITTVIRGQDHLSNTPKHVLLAEYLGFPTPDYAHYSLTHGLSKREGSQSIRTLREKGYLPEAILNAAMLLGWGPKDNKEVFDVKDKIQEFELKDLTKVNAHFDWNKFNWIANEHMKKADPKRIAVLTVPFLIKHNLIKTESEVDIDYLTEIVALVKNGVSFIDAIPPLIDFFFKEIEPDEEAKEILKAETAKPVIELTYKKVSELKDKLTPELFVKLVKEVQKELKVKGKALYMPIRVALTGRIHGPELDKIAYLLGIDKVKYRLNRCISTCF